MKKALLINESGSVIIVMIAVLFMMTIVALSMFSISSDDMTISSNSQNLTKAFYSAESGLAIARSVLWTDYINWASTNPQKLP
ncbi:MAG: pilus assembly PilX N-terminal domain-containing protein, partial [Candidatus Zixiibacteriota bacterium]